MYLRNVIESFSATGQPRSSGVGSLADSLARVRSGDAIIPVPPAPPAAAQPPPRQ